MSRICSGDILENWRGAWGSRVWPPPVSCLQILVLEALPCAVLLLMCPAYLVWLLKRSANPHPLSWKFLAKIVLSLCMAAVTIVHCVVEHHSGDKAYTAVAAGWAVVAVVNMGLVVLERSRHCIRSPILFVFWLVSTASLALVLVMAISREDYKHSLGKFFITLLRCVFTSLIFLLNCFSDCHGSQSNNTSPESVASPLSWITFTWLNRVILRGYKKPPTNTDLYPMVANDTAAEVERRFMACRDMHADKRPEYCDPNDNDTKVAEPSFFMCLLRTFLADMCISHCGTIVLALSNMVTPFILGWMIGYSSDLEEASWHGYIYLAALVSVRLVGAASDQAAQYLSTRLAIRVRTAAIAAIFNKALRMRQNTSNGSSVGEIVNLMSVDTKNLELFTVFSPWLWSSLFHLVLGAYFCYTVSGVSMVSGLGFVVLMLAVNMLTNQKVGGYQEQLMTIGDQRLKIVSEVLDGIKVIKLHGWEPLFSEKILSLRRKELKVLLNIAYFQVLETFAFTASKFWMTFWVLATYVALDSSHHLTAKRAFLITNFINLINYAVVSLPLVVKLTYKMKISVARISEFLQMEDVDEKDLHRDTNDPCAIRVAKADFKWETNGPTILRDIELQVVPGQLVAVVGTVGSGKSSLLAAVLGEMVSLGGYSNINSSVAHVPQEAWIQNLTIRDNILFGYDLDMSWYQAVVKACSLGPDLDMLPAGDFTEIGEKGINLSGGQKQRVSLARAVYSQADIYLLDDPLSAVDSHVGKSIFQNVIGPEGVLRGKTRVLVTHGLQWLPHVDYIYVMEDGRIKEAGTYTALTSSTSGAFNQFVAKFVPSSDQSGDDPQHHHKSERVSKAAGADKYCKSACGSVQDIDVLSSQDTAASSHLLTEDESHTGGQVKWGVYVELFRGYGWKFFALTAVFVICFHCAFNAFYVLLASYTDDRHLANFTELPVHSHVRQDRNRDHLLLLAYCGIIQTIFVILYAFVYQWRHVTTSRVLHDGLLQGIMRAPISFFETTPIGRILNRLSQDVDSLDSFVFFFLEICVEHALFAFGILAVISYSMPMLIIFTVPTVVAIYFCLRVYSRVVCRLNRLASANRSPVFAHFSETVTGLTVIRAQRQQTRFTLNNQVKVDRFQAPAWLAFASNKWMQLWLDMLGCCLLLVVAVYVILYREDLEPGHVGLSLSIVVAITLELKAMSQKSGDLESCIVAVERIQEYSKLTAEIIMEPSVSTGFAVFSLLDLVTTFLFLQAPWNLPGDDNPYREMLRLDNNAKTRGPSLKAVADRDSSPLMHNKAAKCPSPLKLFSTRNRSESVADLTEAICEQSNYECLSHVDSFDQRLYLTSGNSPKHKPRAYTNNVHVEDEKPRAIYGSISNGNGSKVNAFSINDSDIEEGGPLHQNTEPDWPQRATIQFLDFSCRYRQDTERVLKGISCSIRGGEKIGVVGRTGAGKSSLVLSLFRLVEADGGRILIDGVDISTLGLHRLRRALTILPQDPVLFSGSLRGNLDPAGERSEAELWRALEQAHLKQFVLTLPGHLDALVGDSGSNFSMGQRQLVCLARTLLCQTRVLVLDEATAAVDLETDSLVQATIRSAFSSSTVIAIAHRLSTILDYDRVLVLDQGRVVEFDSPSVLLANPRSAFFSLAKEAGLTGQPMDPHK